MACWWEIKLRSSRSIDHHPCKNPTEEGGKSSINYGRENAVESIID